jgi:hypothetical protein
MSRLPKWAVDNRTAVEREAAAYRAMSPAERTRLTAAACRAAARQLAGRADAARIRDHRDQLPASSVEALARLRAAYRAAR